MEVQGILVGAKLVRGVLTAFIDILEDPSKPTKRRKYKVNTGKITERDLFEFAGKAVVATITGGFLSDVWYQ